MIKTDFLKTTLPRASVPPKHILRNIIGFRNRTWEYAKYVSEVDVAFLRAIMME